MITYREDQLSGVVDHADSREYLINHGLPTRNVIFCANDSPRIVHAVDPLRSCLAIGRSTGPMLVAIDGTTGEVVVINGRTRRRFWHANSDIRRFVASIEEFGRRYPFARHCSAVRRLRGEAKSLRAKLLDIDPTSFIEEDGFWPTLMTDIALGDYTAVDER